MSVLMGLGSFRFEITSLNFKELDRVIEARWEAQKRIGARPVMQYFGPDVEEVTLNGTMYPLHPLFAGSAARFEELRSPITARRPHRLASGSGRHFGLWVIQRCSDKQDHFSPDGTPRKLSFTLTLKHSGMGSLTSGAVALF